MEVKSVFLNGFLNKKVYVKHAPSFEKKDASNLVFKLTKALCGLKQGPRAWYEGLVSFFLKIVSLEEN